MDMQQPLTLREEQLLEVIGAIQSEVGDPNEVNVQKLALLTSAVNAVLAEALLPGYSIDFGEEDGLVLRTPSGFSIWFATQDADDKILVLAATEDQDSL